MRFRPPIPILVALLLFPAAARASGESPGNPGGPHELCARTIAAAEAARRVPQHLMQAIAQVESGRWSKDAKANYAWPWTVYAEGRGRYYDTKAQALSAVRALQARGVRNIDVGCMQVNLYFHGRAFSSLEEALDPVHNVAYATTFLVDLRQKTRSWVRAVRHYHSKTRKLHKPYRKKVYQAWRDIRARERARRRKGGA